MAAGSAVGSATGAGDGAADTGPLVAGVAGRYARALFDLARESRAVDAVSADLDAFARLIDESPDLARLVRSPVYTAEQQEAAVAAVLARGGTGGLAANFIRLVARKRRLFALPDMIRAYRALVAESKGIVRAEVRVAEMPSPQLLDEIKASLRDVARAEVDVDLRVDPSLIGGLVVKLGSRMVDASLRTKLNTIRLAMREAR